MTAQERKDLNQAREQALAELNTIADDIERNEIIPTGEDSKNKRLIVDPPDEDHFSNVKKIINKCIDIAILNQQIGELKLQDALEDAHGKADALRGNSSKSSESLVLRDAEHYLWGRMGPGFVFNNKIGQFLVANGGGQLYGLYYDTRKWISGDSASMRSNKNLPASQNGGNIWFRQGLDDWGAFDKDNLSLQKKPEYCNIAYDKFYQYYLYEIHLYQIPPEDMPADYGDY